MDREDVPSVSIIIPTLNEERYAPLLLESLLKVGETMDVIVVDGNSTDKTIDVAKSFIPRFQAPSSLRVVTCARGLSAQRNAGAKLATNDTLLFLDADVIIPSRDRYRSLIYSFNGSGCAAGVAHITPLEKVLRAHIVYWFFDTAQRLLLLFKRPCLGTFCLVTTREVFNTIGGFDETLLVTEDIDFCFRAKAQGPVQQLPVYIPVSARRFIKYGYWHVFWIYLKEGSIFMITGKPRIDKIQYPFGEHT